MNQTGQGTTDATNSETKIRRSAQDYLAASTKN